MRCATSVLVPLAMASGIMNSSDTRLAAIWCPATGVVPSRAMNIAMKLKPETSTRIVAPIGSPSRSWASSARRSGTSRPRPIRAKRL